jgi:RNA polymerase sigma-70 factor (ECF subfamily)
VKGGFRLNGSLLRTNEELSQIYNRHVKTVYNVCFMFMKNRHDTEDMVQNTFIRLMKTGTQFQNQEHEKAWLIRTATNLCKDHYRSWWVNKTVDIDLVADVAVEPPFVIDETLKRVMSLPQKYKTVVYLYYYEGYSTVEIAKTLRKNESTVRSYLYTGRRLLKIEMEGEPK